MRPKQTQIHRMVFALVLLTILQCNRTFAQSKQQNEKPAADYLIEGIVLGPDNNPAPDINIAIACRHQKFETKTDETGKFQLDSVYQFTSRNLIFAKSENEELVGSYSTHSELPREKLTSIKIVLAPPIEVEIKVNDQDGNPVEDANVGVVEEYRLFRRSQTDASGMAKLKFPANFKQTYVYAFKEDVGFDYDLTRQPTPGQLLNGHSPVRYDTQHAFTLGDNRTFQFQLVDQDNQPLKNATVYPWLLQKPGELDDFNFGVMGSEYRTQTDEDGRCTIDWTPDWPDKTIVFWCYAEGFGRERINYSIADYNPENVTSVIMKKLIPITGLVKTTEGTPVPNLNVFNTGSHSETMHKSFTTNADGEFEFMARPNTIYHFQTNHAELKFTNECYFTIEEDTKHFNLSVDTGTLLSGSVSIGEKNAPAEGSQVRLEQEPLEPIEKPAKSDSEYLRPRSKSFTTIVDSNGKFQFRVGPGKYRIRAGHRPVTLTVPYDENPQLDFQISRPMRIDVKGRVLSENGTPMPGVLGASNRFSDHHFPDQNGWVSDDNGEFEILYHTEDRLVYAATPDFTHLGFAELNRLDTQLDLHLLPQATATGKLTGGEDPISNARLIATHEMRRDRDFAGGLNRTGTAFRRIATTDENGLFKFDGLCQGLSYTIKVAPNQPDLILPSGMPEKLIFRPQNGQQLIQLGDVLQLQDKQLESEFDQELNRLINGDAKQNPALDFVKGLKRARERNKHLLIMININEVRWNNTLVRYFISRYGGLWSRQHFEFLGIDSTKSDFDRLKQLMGKLGLEVTDEDQTAFLVVVDPNEQTVAKTNFPELVNGKGQLIDSRILEFLQNAKPNYKDANAILADAQTQALEQGKQLLIVESADWCERSQEFKDVIDSSSNELDQLLIVNIEHRMKNRDSALRDYRPKTAGYPWYGIIDPESKTLICSSTDGDQPNIGFPLYDDGKRRFAQFLRKALPNTTESELNKIMERFDSN